MEKANLTITIDKEGKVTSSVKGVKGKSCTSVDGFLKELGNITNDIKTKEFNEGKEQNQRLVHYT